MSALVGKRVDLEAFAGGYRQAGTILVEYRTRHCLRFAAFHALCYGCLVDRVAKVERRGWTDLFLNRLLIEAES